MEREVKGSLDSRRSGWKWRTGIDEEFGFPKEWLEVRNGKGRGVWIPEGVVGSDEWELKR
ncbi:hypothetical protein ACERII_00550 [Evansella sp. AB-rgal1]|uniref:hypothetical protein n=1 Tax=Evansella sp. AB-rgal1 TaxID=3242696 RepID=UPI00359D8CFE